jgi:hypothetical protein
MIDIRLSRRAIAASISLSFKESEKKEPAREHAQRLYTTHSHLLTPATRPLRQHLLPRV